MRIPPFDLESSRIPAVIREPLFPPSVAWASVKPAPVTTPTLRLIMSCSSSRNEDADSASNLAAQIQRRQTLIERLHADLLLAGHR